MVARLQHRSTTGLCVQADVSGGLLMGWISELIGERVAGARFICKTRNSCDLAVDLRVTEVGGSCVAETVCALEVGHDYDDRGAPDIGLPSIEITGTRSCGSPIISDLLKSIVNALLIQRRSEIEGLVTRRVIDALLSLRESVSFPSTEPKRVHLEAFDEGLTVVLYTGVLLTEEDTTVADVSRETSGNKIGGVVVQSVVRRNQGGLGVVRYEFVNTTNEWGEFVVERDGGAHLIHTGHLSKSGDSFATERSVAPEAGTRIKVVLWAPGFWGISGMAGDFRFTMPQRGDVIVRAQKVP